MPRTPRKTLALGLMDQWLTIEQSLAAPKTVSSLTRSGSTATAVVTGHGYLTDEEIDIAGATQSEYNGRFYITVVDANTFTYPVTGTPVTPATGTITATYISDGAGGRREAWTTLVQVKAEISPLSGRERIQAAAIASNVAYRARIWYRSDVTAKQRGRWGSKVLQFESVIPIDGRPEFLLIDCAEAA
jgi:SPP1 family predicted phage head-tail adaptor